MNPYLRRFIHLYVWYCLFKVAAVGGEVNEPLMLLAAIMGSLFMIITFSPFEE